MLLIKLSDTVNVALCVIAGEYGNGEERKSKLKKAGYNYDTVQKCVNELLAVFNKYK